MRLFLWILAISLSLISCQDNSESQETADSITQKTLYLIRHAKSSHKDKTLDDIERPLKKSGMRDAALMGDVFKQKGIQFDLIITSTATRTRQTTELLSKEMAYRGEIKEEKGIYRCLTSTLRKVIGQVDDKYNHVLIVGHNPAVTELTNEFGGMDLKKMPTGAIAAIQFDAKSWAKAIQQKGKLLFYDYPKNHRPDNNNPNDNQPDDDTLTMQPQEAIEE